VRRDEERSCRLVVLSWREGAERGRSRGVGE